MITVIRKQFKDSGYRLVLWLIVFSLVVGLAPTFFWQFTGSGPWAIKVDGDEITYQEFIREVHEQKDRIAFFKAQYGQIADLLLNSMGISTDPKTLAFDQLVKESLLNQFAVKLGIYLHSNYITKQMNDKEFVQKHLAHIIPLYLFVKPDAIDIHLLKTYLKQRGITINSFEQSIEHALARQQIMELIDANFYVPTFEINQQYITNNASKKFTLLCFNFADFLKKEKEKKASEVMLKTFFDKENRQRRRYWVPEKRSGMHWTFNPASYNIAITQEEINDYYKENKTKKFVQEPIKVQVRQIVIKNPTDILSLEAIRQELLKNPAAFSEKAKKLSQDQESAKNGGLIDPFSRGQQERNFEKAAFLLKADGDISEVINTSEGAVLLQRVKKIKKTYQPIAYVEDSIKKILMEQKFKEQFTQDMKRIIAGEKNNDQVFKNFVSKKDGQTKKVDSTAKDDSKLAQTLFKIKKGDISFYIENGSGIAVQLTVIHNAYLPTLESVKSTVEDDFYHDRALTSLQNALKKAKRAAKDKSFNELHKEFDVKIEKVDWINPTDNEKRKRLKKQGFPIEKMLLLDSVGMILNEQTEKNGYLVRLDEILVPQKKEGDTQWKKAKERIEQSRKNLYKEAFVASLYRNAKIEVNESVAIADEEYAI